MNAFDSYPGKRPCLSEGTFTELGRFIHSRFGIKMPPSKRHMVESRLRKRLAHLGMDNYDAYCRYLFSPEGNRDELGEFIDQITTNKTDFFREPSHFTFLEQHVLPDLVRNTPGGSGRHLRIWSTACSRGHEPYSIAMVVSEFTSGHPGAALSYSILGTDISNRVLEESRRAVYVHDEIVPVAMALRKKYLLRSRDQRSSLVRVVPALRQRVRFRQINLVGGCYDIRPGLDIVFCRNVMIYFDRETQQRILTGICEKIHAGGYLFMGHSEVIHGQALPLKAVAPTIYQKTD